MLNNRFKGLAPKATAEISNMVKLSNVMNAKPTKRNGKTHTFSLAAPGATRVQLAGDFTNWEQNPINMQKGSDGVWHTTVELVPGPRHYRFLVDGRWCDDPQSALHAPNPYGGRNAVRQVV
jgi:1,4-alpha-glucan branching enzyme